MRGLKVFDVYGELHLDRDDAKAALRGIPAALGADADRAGQELGKKMTDGLARSVEASSARVAKARRAEVEAANAVKVAELRVNEAREKGKAPASQMLALENALEKAHYRLASAQSNTVTSTKKLEDAQRLLAKAMGDGVDKNIGPRAQRSGEDAGGKLAMGMRMSIVRNSPLIAAAIGGALAAGAPVALAAATGLFAGIGIVAAAQSQKVQAAWLGTWQKVKAGAIADAAVIEPVLVKMAGQVGASFERMRPQLRDAFSAAGPQIEVFTGGVLKLAENALPGLVRAVEQGMPVTQGLADFLGKTGTGLSDFFDRLSAHAPEAGVAFSSLGDAMGNLLPLLGELLGQGAELASIALPLLSHGLGLVLDVATALGPALPAVVAGFSAFKIVQSLSGPMSSFSGTLGKLASKDIPLVSAAAGGAASAVSGLGVALPLVGIAIGLVSAAMASNKQRTDDWARALLAGGAAAREARLEMEKAPGAWDRFSFSVTHWGNSMGVVGTQQREAKEAADALFRSMDPLSQAQSKVAEWTATLSDRLGDENASSADVEAAKRRLAYWAAQEATAQGQLEMATQGVTQAMIDQANQALAAIDSGFAYRDAQNQLEDAQTSLTEAIRDHGRGSEEAQRAQLALEEQTFRTAAAFGQQQADLSGLKQGDAEYTAFVQEQTLGALVELQKKAGPEMAAAIGQQIAALKAGGVQMSASTALAQYLTGQVNGLTGAIHAVPGQKYVQIDAPTAAQVQQIQSLGYYVQTLPNGNVYVYANTADAERAIANVARARTAVINVLQHILPGGAAGGNVGAIARGFASGGSPSRRGDGRISGPGGPLDDMVPAITDMGEHIRVANSEWIVPGFVAGRQGDAKMSALTSGRADIVPRGVAGAGGTSNLTVEELTARMFEAMTSGVDEGVGGASPELTRSVMRAAPAVGAAVGAAAPRLASSVAGAAPAITYAVAAAGPALTNAVSVAAGSLSSAVRDALLAAGWRGDPTDGQERLYAPAAAARTGSQSYQFDSSRQNDPAYMSWWNGLLAAGWKGNPNDGQERLYSPYARGGRFAAGQGLMVGEEGRELVQFDRPGRVASAGETRKMLAAESKSVVIQHVDLHLQGVFDFTKPSGMRGFLQAIRSGLLSLDREDS